MGVGRQRLRSGAAAAAGGGGGRRGAAGRGRRCGRRRSAGRRSGSGEAGGRPPAGRGSLSASAQNGCMFPCSAPCVRVSPAGASLKGAPHLCQLRVTDPPGAGGRAGWRPGPHAQPSPGRGQRARRSAPASAPPSAADRGGLPRRAARPGWGGGGDCCSPSVRRVAALRCGRRGRAPPPCARRRLRSLPSAA